jgi:iron(III) transport system permease protein
MMQLSADMEEASFIAGGSWLYTFRRIVIPLLGQVMISTAILTFASAARNVANVAMLVTAENRPLAMLQVDYMVDGAYERAAVVGVLIVLITMSIASLAILIARRAGLRT